MRTSALFLLFLFGFVGPLQASDDWSEHPEWLGGWKLTPEIAELLGYAHHDESSAPLRSLQIGFFVSKEATLAVLGEDAVRSAEELIEKMGHKIVAAGRHSEPTDRDMDSVCFVTTKAGATYLWLGDQSKTASFAKVNFVRGVSPAKDILILDFGGIFKQRFRGEKATGNFKAFGYRRQPDHIKSK